MKVTLLRKMTFKSILNFGKNKDLTVLRMFELGKTRELISIYFKLSKITFTDDVLDTIGITEEYRIKKPGSNKKRYLDFLNFKYGEKKIIPRNKKLLNMRKETKPLSKGKLMNINHGLK